MRARCVVVRVSLALARDLPLLSRSLSACARVYRYARSGVGRPFYAQLGCLSAAAMRVARYYDDIHAMVNWWQATLIYGERIFTNR